MRCGLSRTRASFSCSRCPSSRSRRSSPRAWGSGWLQPRAARPLRLSSADNIGSRRSSHSLATCSTAAGLSLRPSKGARPQAAMRPVVAGGLRDAHPAQPASPATGNAHRLRVCVPCSPCNRWRLRWHPGGPGIQPVPEPAAALPAVRPASVGRRAGSTPDANRDRKQAPGSAGTGVVLHQPAARSVATTRSASSWRSASPLARRLAGRSPPAG